MKLTFTESDAPHYGPDPAHHPDGGHHLDDPRQEAERKGARTVWSAPLCAASKKYRNGGTHSSCHREREGEIEKGLI